MQLLPPEITCDLLFIVNVLLILTIQSSCIMDVRTSSSKQTDKAIILSKFDDKLYGVISVSEKDKYGAVQVTN